MAEKDKKPQTEPKAKTSAKPTQPAAKRAVASKTKTTAKKAASRVSKKTTDEIELKQINESEQPTAINDGANNPQAAVTKQKKLIMIVAVATAFLMILTIVLGLVFGLKSCKKGPDYSFNTPVNYQYTGTTQVGYYGRVLKNVERVKPVAETKDGGLPSGYPKYGYTLSGVLGTDSDKVAARNALIAESGFLAAYGTKNTNTGTLTSDKYTWMDKDGWLYQGTVANPVHALEKDGTTHRQLYKHTAADGLYLGNVADDEPGIVKEVTLRPRGYSSYSVTGVYAPAGEVIKIEISEEDMNATGGITVHIGQALYNGQANNIWAAKNQMQRIPHLLNTMTVNKNTAVLEDGVYTAYVGSFIGGPIYIRNTNVTFTATISGGVTYSHFILGYTTQEEFEKNSKSSAPYFDLEVWDRGVLHSGPRKYAEAFSYDDLYNAAVLWDKVASVTTYNSNQGIVFLYDPFVAAGAAVAFPGRSSVNCPMGWMASSLNYNSIVTSGSWGNFHEYHHNFQGYGVGNGGEVTNNALTLVSYSLFTKISSKRGSLNFGAQGLGGWNNYTSATWALEETLKIARPNVSPSNGNQGLALYATLLHNFGADNFIKTKAAGGGQSYAAYMKAWQNITHNNMYYYFNDILKGTGISNNADSSYPMFVPVSCVYQTGRSYMYDGKKQYFDTMQPYVIPYGQPFSIDLTQYPEDGGMSGTGSIVIPEGFSYTIKNVTQPEHGTVNVVDSYHLTYTPDSNDSSLRSGKIIVTLKIEKDDGAFEVDDVDLVLEFEQSHETNKMTLERTTYTYTADTAYTDAQTAYEKGYAGYAQKTETDHSNPVQNCNTDIWYYPDTQANRDKYPNAPDSHFVPSNSVTELKGKLYIEEEGRYRIYLRGRNNCAVYYSLDGGKTYKLGATIKDTKIASNSAYFRPSDENSYFDLQLDGESWIYFKEVLIDEQLNDKQASYIGLGISKWTEPMFTIVEKFYDAQGNELDSAEAEGYDHTVTHYYNYQGVEVSEKEVFEADLIAPVITNNSQPYVNAFRSDYEFPDNSRFETDYFYVRNYNYSYNESSSINSHKLLGYTNFNAGTYNDVTYPIENLFEGNANGMWNQDRQSVTPDNPFTMTVDAGKSVLANTMVITGRHGATPGEFKLLAGNSPDELTEIEFTDLQKSGTTGVTVTFEPQRFRYYKLVVTRTIAGTGNLGGNYLAITNLKFSYSVSGGKIITPDSETVKFSGNWDILQEFSTFGHIYAGEKDSEMTFDFEGTGFKILSCKKYDADYTVYIDGVEASSLVNYEDNGSYYVSFQSSELTDGSHTVKIVCNGKASVDSIVIY